MEIKNREDAIYLDLILQKLIQDNRGYNSVKKINQNLIKEKTYDYCLNLFYILSAYPKKLLYPVSEVTPDVFWATEYVPAFLQGGGFTYLYDTTLEKESAEKARQLLNDEKLKYDVKNAKRIFSTYWWTFGISILGFLLALGKIICDILKAK